MDAEDLLLREFLGIRTRAGDRGGGPVDPVPAARRRHLGHLRRRPAATCRRPSRRGSRCGWPATPPDAPHMAPGGGVRPGARRRRAHPGVHPDLARAVRALVLGRPARAAAGADLPAALVPAQHLRLRLLGPADGRAADDRRQPASRCGRCRSASTSCAAGAYPPAEGAAVELGRLLPAASTGCCTSTRGTRSGRCAAWPSAGPRSGSWPGRRPTAAGAASSRRGSTR